jgi:hypothetical protein
MATCQEPVGKHPRSPEKRNSPSRFVGPAFWTSCFLAALLISGAPLSSSAAVVPVKVVSSEQTRLLVVPDPSSPTAMHELPGKFYFSYQPNARDWVRTDRGGVVISFMVQPSAFFTASSLKVFDSYGTAVATAEGSLVIPSSWLANNSSVYDYDVYWNGTKTNGDFVHEGVYTAELKYTLAGATDPVVLSGTFYMNQPAYTDVKKNTCGTGYALALIPAIGIRLRRSLLSAFGKKSGRRS